jgi:diamine N-acetyltransferase
MTVELRDITRDNWLECIRLQVRDDQKTFVASNVFSIAQAQFFPDVHPQAIYAARRWGASSCGART